MRSLEVIMDQIVQVEPSCTFVDIKTPDDENFLVRIVTIGQ